MIGMVPTIPIILIGIMIGKIIWFRIGVITTQPIHRDHERLFSGPDGRPFMAGWAVIVS